MTTGFPCLVEQSFRWGNLQPLSTFTFHFDYRMTATSTHFRVDRWLMGRIRRLPWRLGGIISVFAGVTLLLHLFAQVNFLPLDIAKTRWTEQSVRKYTWLPTADYDM